MTSRNKPVTEPENKTPEETNAPSTPTTPDAPSTPETPAPAEKLAAIDAKITGLTTALDAATDELVKEALANMLNGLKAGSASLRVQVNAEGIRSLKNALIAGVIDIMREHEAENLVGEKISSVLLSWEMIDGSLNTFATLNPTVKRVGLASGKSKPGAAPVGRGGGRSTPTVVDGKEYPSMNAAGRTLMGSDWPEKGMGIPAGAAKLRSAGHSVS